MPTAIICLICGALNCTQHDKTRRARRGADSRNRHHEKPPEIRRIYASAAWARCRRVVLHRDPICTICGHAPSTIADHAPPLREQLASGFSGVDPDQCRGICHVCNGRVDGQRARQATPSVVLFSEARHGTPTTTAPHPAIASLTLVADGGDGAPRGGARSARSGRFSVSTGLAGRA